jgi:hypothetical protein
MWKAVADFFLSGIEQPPAPREMANAALPEPIPMAIAPPASPKPIGAGRCPNCGASEWRFFGRGIAFRCGACAFQSDSPLPTNGAPRNDENIDRRRAGSSQPRGFVRSLAGLMFGRK